MTALTPQLDTPRHGLFFWAVLIVIGLAWGATGPLSKLAVSTGHHPFGVNFSSTAIGAVVLTAILLATRAPFPTKPRHLFFYLVCGLLGTALPNTLSYESYRHLPVGVNVIVLSLVPMATLLFSLLLRMERADGKRLLGLALGATAVLVIALPESSLPEPEQVPWVLAMVVVSLSYAAENVFIARNTPDRCGPLTIMCGLSWGAFLLLSPSLLFAETRVDLTPLGPPELAIIAVSGLHVFAYFGFVWLIGNAGSVFASQVGYIVTGSGVALGMLFYGESHSAWIWLALVLMLTGLTLVKPNKTSTQNP